MLLLQNPLQSRQRQRQEQRRRRPTRIICSSTSNLIGGVIMLLLSMMASPILCFTIHHHHHHHHHHRHTLDVVPSVPNNNGIVWSLTPPPQATNHLSSLRRPSTVSSSSSLSSSSSNQQSQSQARDDTEDIVIYQKVLRPPPKQSPAQFLPSLIDFLQMDFRLPNGLSMPYNLISITGDGDNNDNGNDGGSGDTTNSRYSILAIDSPLSRNSRVSRMDVEVIGIYPDDEEDYTTTTGVFPTMVMVVVKKKKKIVSSTGGDDSTNIMTMRLFEDSEKRILKSLEYDLDDFVEGRLGSSSTRSSVSSPTSVPKVTTNQQQQQQQPDDEVEWKLDDFEGLEDYLDGTTEAIGSNNEMEIDTTTTAKNDNNNNNINNDNTKNVDRGFSNSSTTTTKTKERKMKRKKTAIVPPNIELDETGGLVIDATSTNVLDDDDDDDDDKQPEKTKPDSSNEGPMPKKRITTPKKVTTPTKTKNTNKNKNKTATTTTTNESIPTNRSSTTTTNTDDDFAIMAARRRATVTKAAATTSSPTKSKKLNDDDDDDDDDDGGGISSTSSGDYAIDAAKAAAAISTGRITNDKLEEEEDDGDYAMNALKALSSKTTTNTKTRRIDETNIDDGDGTERTNTNKVPATPSTTKTKRTTPIVEVVSTYGQVAARQDGDDNLQLLDKQPNKIPLMSRDNRPGAFRVSISSPSQRQRRKSKTQVTDDGGTDDGTAAATETTTPAVGDTSNTEGDDISDSSNSKIPTTTTTTSTTPAIENEMTTRTKQKEVRREINLVTDTTLDPDNMTEEERQRSLNNIMYGTASGGGGSSRTSAPSSSSIDNKKDDKSMENGGDKKKKKTDSQIEQDIIQAAVELMPGFLPNENDNGSSTATTTSTNGSDKNGGGMTPEELLKDVLKFGEEQDKEEEEGGGFVSGAFAKAKELIQEEKQQQQQQEVRYKDDTSSSGGDDVEEELKRIFAAGENIAENRIAKSGMTFPPTATSTGTSELDKAPSSSVDYDQNTQTLIDSDTTISRNVRTLDDELAELEIRISQTPGEEKDPTGGNPLFDVFSGPETYNPNVDPETSVNWPGAARGTRTDVRMPVELKNAVKNAQFAADLLSKMALVDDDDDDATSTNNDDDGKERRYALNGKEISQRQIQSLQRCVDEGVVVGLIRDPIQYLEERGRLRMVVDELKSQPAERFDEVVENYRELVLSDNFVALVQHRLKDMESATQSIITDMHKTDDDLETLQHEFELERQILGGLVTYAQYLLKQAQALGSELEALQLSVIRSICLVAMDPSHTTETETATALTDAVKDMRPLLDENFVAYLKYAVAEEEAKLERMGLVDDSDSNRWLFVLKIVQQGVYRELEIGVKRYIDHISYVLRMDEKVERKMLLGKLIDVMPSMDVRPFVKVVDNIAASLGSSVKGDFEDEKDVLGGMTNSVLQLRRDVRDLLPPERLNEMSKDADEWAERQREKLLERRNMTKDRLMAAKETEGYDEDDERPGKFREVERMT